MGKARAVLDILCHASRAKVKWGKSVTIWASKGGREWEWEWGHDVGLRWIPEGKGIRYLGIQRGFRLPAKANFDKLMLTMRGKLIA
jgi:hypothetical protein